MKIPRYVASLDLETRDFLPSAYVLAAGIAVFDVQTMQRVDSAEWLMGPDDTTQADRTIGASTDEWWAYSGSDPKYPSLVARDHNWQVTNPVTLRDCCDQLEAFLAKYDREKWNMPIAMRGPDFDYVIMTNIVRSYGYDRYPLLMRMMDSSRTIDRFYAAVDLPQASGFTLAQICPDGQYHKHIALHDAIEEGYHSARYYNFLSKIAVLPEVRAVIAEYTE